MMTSTSTTLTTCSRFLRLLSNSTKRILGKPAAPKNQTIVASVAARLRTLIPINILPGSLVEIFYMSVQQQKNGFDCGIFAIAFVAEIISGKDVTKTRLNGDRLRQFFIASYRSMEIDVFPSTGGRNRKETDPVVLSIRI